MGKVLRCGDIVGGCPEVIRGETEDEIMEKGAVHAEQAHGFKDAPPEILQQVRSLIRDE
jgi:predicted small metal-binding protein